MAWSIYREEMVKHSDPNLHPHYNHYALIWDEDRPESGTVRLEPGSDGRVYFKLAEVDASEPEVVARVPWASVTEAASELRRRHPRAPAP